MKTQKLTTTKRVMTCTQRVMTTTQRVMSGAERWDGIPGEGEGPLGR